MDKNELLKILTEVGEEYGAYITMAADDNEHKEAEDYTAGIATK